MRGDFSREGSPNGNDSVRIPGLVPLSKLMLHFTSDIETPGGNPASLHELLAECFMFWVRSFEQHDLVRPSVFFLTDAQGEPFAVHRFALIDQEQSDMWLSELRKQLGSHCASSKQSVRETIEVNGQTAHATLLPIVTGDQSLAAVFCCCDLSGTAVDVAEAGIGFVTLVELALLKKTIELQKVTIESTVRKREILFQAARKLHAMIDVDSVLTEMISRLNDLFPDVQIDLLLTQDNHNISLPIRLLQFSAAENGLCARTFMEGELMTESKVSGTEVAAPLIGKQGVYGVVHMTKPGGTFSSEDLDMIRTISELAGTAFENARLYEQSNLLISELRLINEITKRLNQSLKLNDIFNFACTELMNIFGADFCCILQYDRRRQEFVVQASNLQDMFHEHYEIDYGFSGIVLATKEPLIISDYHTSSQIQSKLMELTGSRSLIASPILVNREVEGVILVTHRFPNFFTYENYKLLTVLSGHIGLAISNASLHAEVRRMVITDNLTGLFARHYLDEQVGYYQKKDYCGSLIVVDIDNFKGVNDRFGHQIGDKILIQVAHIIKTCIRDSDIAARWGGEELAIYLPQVSIDQAVRIAERIRTRVSSETEPAVTVSCGVAEWNWQDERISVESLFYKSDMALYRAKNEGKNQIKIG